MAAATHTKRYTVDDLAQFPDDGKLRELVDGQIVEWDMPDTYHGFIVSVLTHLLTAVVRSRRLGMVVSGDPLVRVQGSDHDARGPDVAFFARGRIPRNLRAAAADTAPDFVIEVLSPLDRAGDVERKVGDWLRAGVRLLWYVNPETGFTMVYRGTDVSRVPPEDTLDAADVVPGVQVRMQDLLDEAAALAADAD